MNNKDAERSAEIRRKAEEYVSKLAKSKTRPEDKDKILHELLVHQAELEMQNEELRRLQVELDVSRARYFDLFELAPVGYITIDEQGLIIEANLTFATQLGVRRPELANAPASRFIDARDQDAFYLMRKKLLESDDRQTCELRLVNDGNPVFWARAEASAVRSAGGPPATRIAISDIGEMVKTREKLAGREQEYRLLAQNASDVVLRCSPAGIIEWITPSITDLAAWEPQELVGRRFADIVHPDDRAMLLSAQSGLKAGVGFDVELRVKIHRNGWRWFSVGMRPAMDDSGAVTHLVGGWRNIQAEVQAREAAALERARLRATLDSLLDPQVVLEPSGDREGRIDGLVFTDANPAACSYFKIKREEILGKGLHELFPAAVAASLLEMCLGAMESEVPLVRDNLFFRGESSAGDQCFDIRGVKFGGALSLAWRDVTDRHNEHIETERRARTDELTKLLNRKEGLERIDSLKVRSKRSGNKLAVLFCDLDRLKTTNDTHGHAAGDEVLRAMADRIRLCLRGSDDIGARFGGDEMLVLLHGVRDLDDATRIAEKLRRSASEPIATPGGAISTTISIGVTLADPDESTDALIARADDAMYQAKRTGRNQVIHIPAPVAAAN